MAIKELKFKDVIIEFPKIKFKRKIKSDQHKEEQKQSVYDPGQDRLGREIETLVREARLHLKDGRQ